MFNIQSSHYLGKEVAAVVEVTWTRSLLEEEEEEGAGEARLLPVM